MTHTVKTLILLFVVVLLMGATAYVSIVLKDETVQVPETIQKNKPAARTYSKTLSLNIPSPTIVVSPADEESFAAIQNPNITISPDAQTSSTPTPTTSFFASSVRAADVTTTPSEEEVTPTEVILAKAESTNATESATTQPTKTILAELPDAGWIKPSHLFFVFAFTLIFFSLIY